MYLMNDLCPEYIFKDLKQSKKYASKQMKPKCVKQLQQQQHTKKNLHKKEPNNPILKLATGLNGHFSKDRQTAYTHTNIFSTTNNRVMQLPTT